jgi:hypothetical protein
MAIGSSDSTNNGLWRGQVSPDAQKHALANIRAHLNGQYDASDADAFLDVFYPSQVEKTDQTQYGTCCHRPIRRHGPCREPWSSSKYPLFAENYAPSIEHEYQFDLDTNEGQLALERSVKFVDDFQARESDQQHCPC